MKRLTNIEEEELDAWATDLIARVVDTIVEHLDNNTGALPTNASAEFTYKGVRTSVDVNIVDGR